MKAYRWWWAAIAYFVVTLIFYRHTIYSKFLFDWNTNMLHYMKDGWQGFSSCWDDKSMRWGYHLLNMVQWKLFGFDQRGWFITSIAFHAANATLLSFLTYRTLAITSLHNRFLISISAGLLWLISPYHSEPVVWGAAILFLALTFLVLAGLLFFIRYTETLQVQYALLVYVCYFLAMFTFEAFLPFVGLLTILWIATTNTAINRLRLSGFLKSFFLPLILSIVVYFLINKWRIGSWVGHYGEASHLNTDLFLIVPNFSKYLLKLLFAPLYFSFSQRDAVYAFLESKTFVVTGTILYLVFFVFLIWRFFKGTVIHKIIIAWFFLFCAALVPVINLYFMYYKDIEQDRYVYFASSFFYVSVVLALFHFMKRWAIIPVALFLIISSLFLARNTNCWAKSGRIAQSLLHDFRWPDANRIFVLLTPDDYNGAYCMRSMPNSTLSEMLRVQRNIDVDDKLFEVYQTNLVSPSDSAVCEILDSSTLHLTLLTQGAWLWRNSFGATDIDTGSFHAQINRSYPAFTVRFKNKQPGDVFIYSVNDHWKEINGF
ncbi:MAG: hypothetical protein IPP77_15890 [Bacteroidetes bacterium]|nr:hypothetical protein [Bacteroidota bacterium]